MTRILPNSIARTEFGDFQTPDDLARQVCRLLKARGVEPVSILEPTCGIGQFLAAASEAFHGAQNVSGFDINPAYVNAAKDRVSNAIINEGDFFSLDWRTIVASLPEPLLVVGNPPWVTNAGLGVISSKNLPAKSNFQNLTGLAAKTGKSNFDISEWMIVRLLQSLEGRRATLAMLCKTVVARRVLEFFWRNDQSIGTAEIHPIDAMRHFGAAVDACLFICHPSQKNASARCRVFECLNGEPKGEIGFEDDMLLADADHYTETKDLLGNSPYQWRSGVKHDCQKIMELEKRGTHFVNGLEEVVDIEEDCLFPMLKSSWLTRFDGIAQNRWMIVTQRAVGEDTRHLGESVPKTWGYLMQHAERLDGRRSSIYRGRPRFAMFGVGEYTFSSWKVAISGFYKKLTFTKVGPVDGKPVVFDDTVYFVPCRSEQEAELIKDLLNSETAKRFFSAFIFWDAKRPITSGVLKRLDLWALAEREGFANELEQCRPDLVRRQPVLF